MALSETSTEIVKGRDADVSHISDVLFAVVWSESESAHESHPDRSLNTEPSSCEDERTGAVWVGLTAAEKNGWSIAMFWHSLSVPCLSGSEVGLSKKRVTRNEARLPPKFREGGEGTTAGENMVVRFCR